MGKTAYQIISRVETLVDHLEATKLGGDAETITLHGIAAGGGVSSTPLKTLDSFWTHNQLGDGLGGFIDQFVIAETELTAAEARATVAIKFAGKTYSVPAKKQPQGRDRKWRFRTRALENG